MAGVKRTRKIVNRFFKVTVTIRDKLLNLLWFLFRTIHSKSKQIKALISCEMVTLVVYELIFNMTCKQTRFSMCIWVFTFFSDCIIQQWLPFTTTSLLRAPASISLDSEKRWRELIMRQKAVCEVIQLLVIFCTNPLISAFGVLLSLSHVVMDAHVYCNLLWRHHRLSKVKEHQ